MMTKYFNRELSWLRFNHRVLQEAADPTVPLIERLRFLGIFSNNLDEFFRVRYATIRRIFLAGKNATRSLGGIPAKDLLEKITQEVIEDQSHSFTILKQLEKELSHEGIIIVNDQQIMPAHEEYVRNYFNNVVSPALATIMIHEHHSLPPLRDGLGYLAVKLIMKKDDQIKYALIEMPRSLDRFIELPDLKDGKTYLILLDDLIRARLHYLFNIFDYHSIEAHMIKVTLDAELDMDIDLKKSLIEKISRSVKGRKHGSPVRFVYDKEISPDTLDLLLKHVKTDDSDSIIPGGRYHNRRDYLKFPSLGRTDLMYQKQVPLPIKNVDPKGSLLKRISQKDFLQYTPYHTFSNTVKFLREAALDPQVKCIKITIYRLAEVSQIASSLINAAKNGKEVIVSIELQARFDEQANINYAELMQEEGVQLIFGVPGLKVHCKACVIHREEDGKMVRYGFISTGNFNESTAKIYTDYTLFTADKRILKEVDKVFDFFQVNYKLHRYKHLLVSPHYLRQSIEAKVRREMSHAQDNKKAYIRMKLNSLSDFKMIDLFYKASQQGVTIDLIVRGICCLIPGVKGMSDNIKVISVVDKYLEHPRVYEFYNNGDHEVYISSADMMGRNLDHRVEIACPIYDEDIKKEVLETLDICWNDNVKAREICEHQLNKYIQPVAQTTEVRSQVHTYNYYVNA